MIFIKKKIEFYILQNKRRNPREEQEASEEVTSGLPYMILGMWEILGHSSPVPLSISVMELYEGSSVTILTLGNHEFANVEDVALW